MRLNNILRKGGYDIDNLRYPEGYQEAPLAYDAVWSVALGKYGGTIVSQFNYNYNSINYNYKIRLLNEYLAIHILLNIGH